MVQSLGISVGNSHSYIAAGQAGGIEILLNEYSNRSTPSMVAFTDQFRAIGVDASLNFFMNLKNTVYDLMILLGKPYKDIQLEDSKGRQLYPFKLEEGPDNQPLVVVTHLGEERKFSITQVLAMLFTKLRSIAGDSVNCVLSCPQFYTDDQKVALFQAALIAGLSPLQIITDMSAVALNYVYFRTKKEDTPKMVTFVNFGQSNLQTAVAWLSPQDDLVKILASESELIGGRDFDRCLADHFITTHNLELNIKSHLKLISACEKVKCLLSANTNEIPLNVESLLGEDKDFTARIDRVTFESVCEPLLRRVEQCFVRTIENAKANIDETMAQAIEAAAADATVEMVGASSRIPAVRQLMKNVFGRAPSTTLNTDEAVTRGCLLHCATLHPGMKVKRIVKIVDVEPFSRPSGLICDKELRRIELELITEDRKYLTRTEARNNLEEFIYSERSKLQGGDQLLQHLSDALEWLFGDEGEDASEETYVARLSELKKLFEARLATTETSNTTETNDKPVSDGDHDAEADPPHADQERCVDDSPAG